MVTAKRPSTLNVAIGAALLQAVCLLLVAIPALLVSSAFCDGAGPCATRGLRWAVWMSLSLALLLCSPCILLTSMSASRSVLAIRWLVRLEVGVILLCVVAVALALGSVVVTIDALFGLVIFLGAVVLVGACASRQSRLWIASLRQGYPPDDHH